MDTWVRTGLPWSLPDSWRGPSLPEMLCPKHAHCSTAPQSLPSSCPAEQNSLKGDLRGDYAQSKLLCGEGEKGQMPKVFRLGGGAWVGFAAVQAGRFVQPFLLLLFVPSTVGFVRLEGCFGGADTGE